MATSDFLDILEERKAKQSGGNPKKIKVNFSDEDKDSPPELVKQEKKYEDVNIKRSNPKKMYKASELPKYNWLKVNPGYLVGSDVMKLFDDGRNASELKNNFFELLELGYELFSITNVSPYLYFFFRLK